MDGNEKAAHVCMVCQKREIVGFAPPSTLPDATDVKMCVAGESEGVGHQVAEEGRRFDVL